MLLWWGLAAVCGYALGSINPAVLIARVFGKDLRQVGSGNPGATNVGRALGPKWGVLVGFLDILKGLVPALVFGMLAGEIAGEIAGLAAVLGHITSPFLKGRGGKGVSTTLGAILGVHMVGPKVTDLIAEASLAMELGATAAQVGGTTHPHPTLSEIVGEAALVSIGRSVNF